MQINFSLDDVVNILSSNYYILVLTEVKTSVRGVIRYARQLAHRQQTATADPVSGCHSRKRLNNFFTLTENDWRLLTKIHNSINRLGFSLQFSTLRYLGFIPENLTEVPVVAVEFLARQLAAAPELLNAYGGRSQTRTDHPTEIEAYLGFHKATEAEMAEIDDWLMMRAVEHDRPLLLLQMLCERLRSDKIIRFSLTRLERKIVKARRQARKLTWQTVAQLIKEISNRQGLRPLRKSSLL